MTAIQQKPLLNQRRGSLTFYLRFALYTVASFLPLYALHEPVVVRMRSKIVPPLTLSLAPLQAQLIG